MGPNPVITPEATYTPVSKRDCSRSCLNAPPCVANLHACKDLGRNGQKTAITPKAAYTPAANRTGSRPVLR
ncbi:alpha-galactosidase [Lacticaseibacillus paracasei]|nr:hypothetical protein LCAZH_1542 [Lacticaseibacillus paracasei]AGP68422.1 Alpha-galactosidase [Lacticaseibacillus paracasei]AYG21943.1 alpha-galactosidase [Lacticaseibacillus paracasei]OSP85683.1 alpha-galactosidase [Lacticaseibacillus paracasei]TJY23741.1 alpha-galactosidase [Lacticaseibacillus paracasei]